MMVRFAGDELGLQIDTKRGLRNAVAVAYRPRCGNDRDAGHVQLSGPLAREITAVNVECDDWSDGLDFAAQDVSGQVLRLVCRSDGGGENERTLEVTDGMALEAIEETRLRLAAVGHVLVGDRGASISGNAPLDSQLSVAVGIGLKILLDDFVEKVEGFIERRLLKGASECRGEP